MNRRQLTALGGVALAAGAAGGYWRWREDNRQASNALVAIGGGGAPQAGSQADGVEAFWAQSAPTPAGSSLAFATLRGRPLLVNFWATWCPPCIREMPLIDRFHAAAASTPARWQVLGVAIDRVDAVRGFLERQPVGYPIVVPGFDGSQWMRSLGNENGGLPFTLVFDAAGGVQGRKLGEVSAADLLAWSGVAVAGS
jgi:thiol-disulfide isomerase/thioredoxin